MVFQPGLDSKLYWEQLTRRGAVPEIACPNPSCQGCFLRAHGWHGRFLGGRPVALRRLVCRRCRQSHVLLPEDVCAYRDLTLPVLQTAVQTRDGPSAAARAVGQVGAAALRRARRWLKGSSWERLEKLLPAVGSLWRHLDALLGVGADQLVRLRRWLWSRRGFLLGGPTRLFWRGRPGQDRGGACP